MTRLVSSARPNVLVVSLLIAMVALCTLWPGGKRATAVAAQGRLDVDKAPLHAHSAVQTPGMFPGAGLADLGQHLRLTGAPAHDPQRPDHFGPPSGPPPSELSLPTVLTLTLNTAVPLIGREVTVTFLRIYPHSRKSSVQLAVERTNWQRCVRRVAEGDSLTWKFRQHTYAVAVVAVSVEDQQATIQVTQDATPNVKPTC